MIEAVIFDLDGTLIHLPIDYEKLFDEFKRIMHADKVQPVTEVVSRLDEKTRREVFKTWDETELAAAPNIVINKEGMGLYQTYLRKPKALVTMQGKAVMEKILDQLELSFKVILTREDSLDRAEQLESAAGQLKTRCRGVLFVGNTDNDALAADKVGCQFLRVK